MKKEFFVYADVTAVVHVCVTAENEEEAKKMAKAEIATNPYSFLRKADACVNVEVTDVIE